MAEFWRIDDALCCANLMELFGGRNVNFVSIEEATFKAAAVKTKSAYPTRQL